MAESFDIGDDSTPENNLSNFYEWPSSLVLSHHKKGEHEQGFALSQELIYDALTPPWLRMRCHLYLAMSDDSPVLHAEEALRILDDVKSATPEDIWNKTAAIANGVHSRAINWQIHQDAKPELPLLSKEEYESPSEDESPSGDEEVDVDKPAERLTRIADSSRVIEFDADNLADRLTKIAESSRIGSLDEVVKSGSKRPAEDPLTRPVTPHLPGGLGSPTPPETGGKRRRFF